MSVMTEKSMHKQNYSTDSSFPKYKQFRCSLVALLICLSHLFFPTSAAPALAQQEGEIPEATIINDEGGPVAIRGEVSYTNEFFTTGVAAPMVILEDQAGFIDRNEYYVFPVQSQTLGQITSDFYDSPFTYSVALPIEPQGTLRDVDHDGERDLGVMVFAVAYWTNTFGDPFLEERDLFGGGWSTAYASTRVSSDVSNKREIVGGKFLVYAADDQQAFPSGYGPDGKIFTDDDPLVLLPQGYTIVDVDPPTFLFDRSKYPTINLIEPDNAATVNYATLSYSEAFDALIAKMRKEYAFTDYKEIDWAELSAQFRPLFVTAEEENDSLAYRRALRDFIFEIPDGHMSGPFLVNEFRQKTAGGIGLALRETDDGEVIANFVLQNGPADQLGVEFGATILEIDGQEIQSAINGVVPDSSPFSTEHVKRLQQLRYLVRSPLNTRREFTFLNPGEVNPRTVTLRAIAEQESFRFSSLRRGLTGYELPVEYSVLPSGYAYVQIYSFSDNELLTIQLWERLMGTLQEQNVPGLIIDMRQNTGGSGFLADQMAAYFFDEPHDLGVTSHYNEEIDDFFSDERGIDRFYPPAAEQRYYGDIDVLVGPDCNSACEFFAYALTIENRAEIVGQYPTAGLGGSIDLIVMPEGEQVRYTAGRALDPNGEIHIEGKGVVPTVKVPVTSETLLSEDDVVLLFAVRHLDGQSVITVEDGGSITINEPVENQPFAPGVRTRYSLTVEEDRTISIYLGDDTGAVDTVLRLYREDGLLLLDNYDDVYEDSIVSSLTNLQLLAGATVLIEASAFQDSSTGNYSLVVVDVSSAPLPTLTPLPLPTAIPTVIPTVIPTATPRPTAIPTAIPTVTPTAFPTATPISFAPTQPTAVEGATPSGVTPFVEPTSTETEPETAPTVEDAVQDQVTVQVTNESLAGNTTAVGESLGSAKVVTLGARLRVRSEPNAESEIVGYVLKDSVHDVVEISSDGAWVRIFIPGININNSGWVSIDFIEISAVDQ